LAPVRLVGKVNGLLTAGFMCSVGVLFAVGAPLARWSRLARADWSCCWAQVPAVLQILVYLEVMPTICQLLEFDKKRIRRAVFIGASCVLLLDLCWSALGIGLVPFAGMLGGRQDPVDVLLHAGGPVAVVINILGACAIATTVLSTNLATKAFFADACRNKGPPSLPLLLAIAAVLGPLLVATVSPGVFFKAISLQGAYPLTLLWGILPPLIAMRTGAAKKASRPKLKKALFTGLISAAGLTLAGRLCTDLINRFGSGALL